MTENETSPTPACLGQRPAEGSVNESVPPAKTGPIHFLRRWLRCQGGRRPGYWRRELVDGRHWTSDMVRQFLTPDNTTATGAWYSRSQVAAAEASQAFVTAQRVRLAKVFCGYVVVPTWRNGMIEWPDSSGLVTGLRSRQRVWAIRYTTTPGPYAGEPHLYVDQTVIVSHVYATLNTNPYRTDDVSTVTSAIEEHRATTDPSAGEILERVLPQALVPTVRAKLLRLRGPTSG